MECQADEKFDAIVAEWSEGNFAEFENTKPRQDDLICGTAFVWRYEEDPEDIIEGNTANLCMPAMQCEGMTFHFDGFGMKTEPGACGSVRTIAGFAALALSVAASM